MTLPNFWGGCCVYIMSKKRKRKSTIDLEEGWAYILNEGILKVEAFVNNRTPDSAELSIFSILNRAQYMEVYVKAYDMCLQRAPYNWSAPLYERHEMYIKGYLERTVLPTLQGKHHGCATLLAELAKRWVNHKFMTKCLDGFSDT